MIGADDVLSVEWLDINSVTYGDAQPVDLDRVAYYRRLMESGPAGAHLAPPMVSPWPDHPDRYRIRDGKHRWTAELTIGRARVRCLVVRPAPAREDTSP